MVAVTISSDFGAQNYKVYHCFHCFPFICHEVMGPELTAEELVLLNCGVGEDS